MLTYIEGPVEVKESLLWWQKQGLMETATGYGRKLNTGLMAFCMGRWRRVYAVCCSNVSSSYVIVKGQRLFIREL